MAFEWIEPSVTPAINRLSYRWDSLDLLIEADRITDVGQAELWFYHANGATPHKLLHIAKTNLLSSSTMTQLAKRMATHSEDIPWTQVLTYITKTTMEYQRRGEPGVTLQPVSAEVLRPAYYIDPVVMKGVPNVLFGEKGVNKTTLALAMLGLILVGYEGSPCGLMPSGTGKVAMLDWEANQELTNYTVARLIEGETILYYELPYLRCKQTLVDDIDRIGNFLHDNEVDVVLIDSLGQAAGSDKFDSSGKASALRFFEALRQLNITSLIIGQTAKGEEKQRTIFGSTYFTYYSRNIFELKSKQDELDDSQAHLALFHQESNYSKKHQPLGFLCSYTETSIAMGSESVSVSEFLEKASQTKDIIEFLKTGAKTRHAVALELGMSDNQTSVQLNRLARRKLVINLGSGMWGVLTTN